MAKGQSHLHDLEVGLPWLSMVWLDLKQNAFILFWPSPDERVKASSERLEKLSWFYTEPQSLRAQGWWRGSNCAWNKESSARYRILRIPETISKKLRKYWTYIGPNIRCKKLGTLKMLSLTEFYLFFFLLQVSFRLYLTNSYNHRHFIGCPIFYYFTWFLLRYKRKLKIVSSLSEKYVYWVIWDV